jgi:T-complex protein 1 subunit theta
VLSIAGELLSNAEGLLRDGLHTAEVADGYVQAAAKACAHFRHQSWQVE